MNKFKGWFLSVVTAAAVMAGCATNTPAGGSPPADVVTDLGVADATPADARVLVCTPGRTESCPCAGFSVSGTQTCNVDGSAFGPCMGCPSSVDGGVPDVSNPGCTPGEPRFCVSPTCAGGTAYCNATGTAFGACGCLVIPDAGPDLPVIPDASVTPDVMGMDASSDAGPVCPADQVACMGRCVNPVVAFIGDADNCGRCGNMCVPPAAGMSATCIAGVCNYRCATGFADCDLNGSNGCETPTNGDNGNCGACGRVCSAQQICLAGGCTNRCPSGQTFCGGGCVNTQIDNGNCGQCGNACATPNGTPMCRLGTCAVAACNAGFRDCDLNASNGCEIEITSDNAHCGACNRACPAGQACSGGACVNRCATGQTFCGGGCVDTQSDPLNCGGCNTRCLPGNVCVLGGCAAVCRSPLQICTTPGLGDGACVDVRSNLQNCGACGRLCNPFGVSAAQCVDGVCGYNRCLVGMADCDGNVANGCEVDLYTNNNCGACGNACPARANASGYCFSQVCAISCNSGFGNCDGTDANGCEINIRTNLQHCGACGRTCLTNRAHMASTCNTGACSYACEAGFADCDGDPANGCEIDLNTDTRHCGRCSTLISSAACATTQVCAAGRCFSTTPVCGAGTANCLGICTNIVSDPLNCGACGVRCSTGQVCSSGSCSPFCMAPGSGATTACSGSCVDIRVNPAHCGACDRVCAVGQTCFNGTCTVFCGAGFTPCAGTCVDTQIDAMNCGSCGGRCAAGLVCLRGVCNVPPSDASGDVTADAIADVVPDNSDGGTSDVADVLTDAATDNVDVSADLSSDGPGPTGFRLWIRPPTGTATTSPSGGTTSFATLNRAILIHRTWRGDFGGIEALPRPGPGGIYSVDITPGVAMLKFYIGGFEQNLCNECARNGRCTLADLGYVNGDLRIIGNDNLSSAGENADGRIVDVSQIPILTDPFVSNGTCAAHVPISLRIGTIAPGGVRPL